MFYFASKTYLLDSTDWEISGRHQRRWTCWQVSSHPPSIHTASQWQRAQLLQTLFAPHQQTPSPSFSLPQIWTHSLPQDHQWCRKGGSQQQTLCHLLPPPQMCKSFLWPHKFLVWVDHWCTRKCPSQHGQWWLSIHCHHLWVQSATVHNCFVTKYYMCTIGTLLLYTNIQLRSRVNGVIMLHFKSYLSKEYSIFWFMALDRRNVPRLITCRSRGRGRWSLVPLFCFVFWSWLASNRAIPLWYPPKIKVEISNESFLMIRNFTLCKIEINI